MASRRIKAVLSAEDRASPKFNKVSASVKALGAIAAFVGSIQLGRKLVDGLRAAVRAAAVQETADIRLAAALRSAGQASTEALVAIKKQAAGLQDLTGVGDELIQSGQALLVTMGKLSGEGLERATKAALDMAAVTGNLQGAFDLVAKASVGYTSTLSRYGIILDESIPKSEKFGAALSKIEELFGGQAQAQLRTYAGRLQELQGRFGDLQETIGGPFRDVLKVTFEVLSASIDNINDSLVGLKSYRTAVISAAIAVVEFGIALETLDRTFKIVDTVVASARNEWNKFALGVIAATNALGGYDKAAQNTEGVLTGLRDRLRLMLSDLESLSGIGATVGFGFIQAAADIAQFGIFTEEAAESAEKLEETVTSLGDRVIGLSEAVHEFVNVGSSMQDVLALSNRSVVSLGRDLSQTFRRTGVTAVGRFSDALVDAAATGQASFKKFFQSLLADLATAIAKALVLRAILSLFGGGGVGAGAGSTLGAGGGAPSPLGFIPFPKAAPPQVINMYVSGDIVDGRQWFDRNKGSLVRAFNRAVRQGDRG